MFFFFQFFVLLALIWHWEDCYWEIIIHWLELSRNCYLLLLFNLFISGTCRKHCATNCAEIVQKLERTDLRHEDINHQWSYKTNISPLVMLELVTSSYRCRAMTRNTHREPYVFCLIWNKPTSWVLSRIQIWIPWKSHSFFRLRIWNVLPTKM